MCSICVFFFLLERVLPWPCSVQQCVTQSCVCFALMRIKCCDLDDALAARVLEENVKLAWIKKPARHDSLFCGRLQARGCVDGDGGLR